MKSYKEIISVVSADVQKLEEKLAQEIIYPTMELKNLILAPAKRIRPVLAFLFLRANGITPDNSQITLQSAVELVHTASLVHDDIIDESSVRRGLETLNSKYSDKLAVLSGDYLLSLALKKLTTLGNINILQAFFETFEEMVQGEINQYFTKGQIPTLDDYIAKTVAKTANLFKLALTTSAEISKTSISMAEDFGLNFGIAFQIKNDLEDYLGNNQDFKNGIFTLPMIFEKDLAIDKTKSLMNIYIKQAKNSIKDLPKNDYKKALEEILECFIND